MEKKSKPNHEADIKNRNAGTTGNNPANAKAEGNRGKQISETTKIANAIPPNAAIKNPPNTGKKK